jgi:outer membrane biosynthesis protein TonB
MTRTDVMASSRPQAVRTTFMRSGSRRALRRLVLAPLALVLTIALVGPTTAFAAAESTSGYNQTPNTPTTTTTTTTTTPTTPTTTTPSTGTSPEKETKTPTSEKTSPTPTTETAKTGTLPFTGFDLRWSLGFGLVLMGAGFAIVAVQRRQRRQDGR